jgi:hypothetical protein
MPNGTWNYRVVHYNNGTYGIIEAFYDEEGDLDGYVSSEDLTLYGFSSVDELKDTLRLMINDVSRKVLEESELPGDDHMPKVW